MKPVRLLALALALALLPIRWATAEEPVTSAGSAALFEAGSGRFLYGDNEHQRAYMASTTKVMTGLIAVERGNLDEPVPVPDAAVGTEGSIFKLLAEIKRDLSYIGYLGRADAFQTFTIRKRALVQRLCLRQIYACKLVAVIKCVLADGGYLWKVDAFYLLTIGKRVFAQRLCFGQIYTF